MFLTPTSHFQKKYISIPDLPMSSETTGDWTITGETNLTNFVGWSAFNRVIIEELEPAPNKGWGASEYTNGIPKVTAPSTDGVLGAYLEVKNNVTKYSISTVKLYPRYRFGFNAHTPVTFQLFGSNDSGASWVSYFTSQELSASDYTEFKEGIYTSHASPIIPISNQPLYKWHRIVFTEMSSSSFAIMVEVELTGTIAPL